MMMESNQNTMAIVTKSPSSSSLRQILFQALLLASLQVSLTSASGGIAASYGYGWQGDITGYFSYINATCTSPLTIQGVAIMEYDNEHFTNWFGNEFEYEGTCLYYANNGTINMKDYMSSGMGSIFKEGYCVECDGIVGCSQNATCATFMTKSADWMTTLANRQQELEGEAEEVENDQYQMSGGAAEEVENGQYQMSGGAEEVEDGQYQMSGGAEEVENDQYQMTEEVENDQYQMSGGAEEVVNNQYQMALSSSSGKATIDNDDETFKAMEGPMLSLQNKVASTIDQYNRYPTMMMAASSPTTDTTAVYHWQNGVVEDGPLYYLVGGTIGGVGLIGLVVILEKLRQRRVAKEEREIQLAVVSKGGYVNAHAVV